MKYTKIMCKSAIHKLNSPRLPYHQDLNIYRGCEHKCAYCFAAYTHEYLNSEQYFDEIFIKENIVDVLHKELMKSKHKDVINLGGVCDSYQPIEKDMKLMAKILQMMITYQNPVVISTKSNLILRDLDYISKLSNHTQVNVAATITCMDEHIQKTIEPNASSSLERFEMLKQIKEHTNASVGVHVMPIIPYLSDSLDNLEAIFIKAKEIHADYILLGILNLKGNTRSNFFNMIVKEFPQYYKPLHEMYKYGSNRSTYYKELQQKIHYLQNKYQIYDNYMDFMKEEKETTTQLSLF